jgi:hypothetical protein
MSTASPAGSPAAASSSAPAPFTAGDIHPGDVIRVLPGVEPCRVYRPRRDGHGDEATVRVLVGTTAWHLPAGLPVELVARHGEGRPVSLVKAWYLGPVGVGSTVVYLDGPRVPGQPALVYRVTRVQPSMEGTLHWLADPGTGVEVFAGVPLDALVLVRSRALEAVRRSAHRARPAG